MQSQTQKQIISVLDSVINQFKDGYNKHLYPNEQLSLSFRTLLIDTIWNYSLKGSIYHIEIKKILQNEQELKSHYLRSDYSNDVKILYGILIALREKYRIGAFNDFEYTIRAEIFEDFLSMAEHLLDNGYKDAAAVIIGGVLETHLKKVCLKHEIPINSNDGKTKRIGAMEEELYKKEVFNTGDHKQLIAWIHMRNDAAHAQYNEYNLERVKLMLQGLRDFILRYPA